MLTHAILRKQRPVGHGFFHEAALRLTGVGCLRWVYDCGGGRQTKGQVHEYLEEIRRAPIDMLFVSHLHHDHVSGLPALLEGTTVKRVFIPHVTEVERILILLRVMAEGIVRPWYFQFLKEPADWLRSRGAESVVEVTPSPDGTPRTVEPQLADAPDDLRVVLVGPRGQRLPPEWPVEIGDDTQVLVEGAGVAMQFVLYVQPAELTELHAFHQRLSGRVPVSISDLASRSGISALRAAFTVIWDDINWTSLCVASVPLSTTFVAWRWHRRHWSDLDLEVSSDRPGWLGLGDAVLSDPANVKKLVTHFGKALERIGSFAVPHHGSDHNYCDELLDIGGGAFHDLLFYATAKSKSLKHPSLSVKRSFEERGRMLRIVSEERSSVLVEQILLVARSK